MARCSGSHMDYGAAIQVLEWANEKFEFPVNRPSQCA
jgi:hypothetical protein